jgi:hypothetical protein
MMSETTIERLCKAFHQNLVALGYPEISIRHYERQRLNGDWDQVFEIANPESGLLLAVVALHTANASVQSYAANLSYSKNNECIRLSMSPDAGIQGFLFSRGSGNQLDFYQVKNSDCDTCLVVEINEFPSFEKLKRQHKLKKLSQDVASCSGKVIYRKGKGDDQKFNKKRG